MPLFLLRKKIYDLVKKSNIFSHSVVDYGFQTSIMGTMMKRRKKRVDRNHIVYQLVVRDLIYIGVTYVENKSPSKSLKRRWRKHVQRALTEGRNWALCRAIRKYGRDAFTVEVLEVVRGRKPAHARERELIAQYAPALNTH